MRSDRFYLGGVNRVLSYYCLFYLGAVVRELQKTVRTEKYHYWKTQRHIDNYEDFDVVNRAVDFKQVNEILNGERNKANNFIDTVIEDVLKQSKKGVNTK